MKHHSILPVKWRETIYNLTVCYSADKVKEILDRWPDGYVDLVNIFEHETTSSIRAKIFILQNTFLLAKESIDTSGDIETISAKLKEMVKEEPKKVFAFQQFGLGNKKEQLAKLKLQRVAR